MIKLIVSKLAYYPVWIAIVNNKRNCSYPSIPLNLLPSNLPVLLNLPSIFHVITTSTKWVLLSCLYYSSPCDLICDQQWQLIYGFNKKLWHMLIVWHQNHWVLFFVIPGNIFCDTQWEFLICPCTLKKKGIYYIWKEFIILYVK